MKKLTLIRHAKSDWHSSANTDFDRPLNERGKKAASLMGKRLAERGCAPELIISSPARRARQTAKRIAKQIGYAAGDIVFREQIYDAELATLLELIQQLDDRYDDIILIGHNPGFSELGEWFTDDAPEWLPTCGILELELACDLWAVTTEGCAQLVRYDYPKKPF
ncbi:phosphohistidine phosphatase [Malonomonas rubra DSM 5091]|uniref:Phosphohistidine phosphatase n=1 Tax=Malonomonas rubra DSM 5091 TaxID=1122189 RepID=A0A1M6GIK9_MALRU|nr:histidine phosphatase family protein [Malonomonas rubra]SHJ09769.1 phosphohistidine phosphatase [Malonomonas rubra DSM 5091]